jgi:hypothetical protein
MQRIGNIGRGLRIAAGMLTGSLRSIYTVCILFCFNAIFLLYYYDVIMRTLFEGGSPIAWTIINIFKLRGLTIPTHVFGVEWALHFPEYFIFFTLMALFSLIMMYSVNNSLERGSCRLGRSFFRAVRLWRFIIVYALCMSFMAWMIGDFSLNCVRWILVKIDATPILIESLYDPAYGKKTLHFLMTAPYWLSENTRLAIGAVWYFGTFLLFPIVAIEQCSFLAGLRRSCALLLHNIGLVFSGALFYLLMYVGGIAATLYTQVATLPSLEGLDMKASVQVIVLFAFMTLVLWTVHSALVSSGALIASVFFYRLCVKQKIPVIHTFSIDQPYWSSLLYLMFLVFYWIIIRCGIHVQMPAF